MVSGKKKRLDEILLERGFTQTIEEARQLSMEGFVIVAGEKSISPAQMFPLDVDLRLRKKKQFVGRGALKLEHAIKKFNIDVSNKICVDIGASTGGFTQVLLNHGANKVYAIDTTYGKLDLKLREDPRVITMEKTDIRDVEKLPDKIDVAVMDISLIPLSEILPHAKRLLSYGGEAIALLKPQYETRNPKLLRNGVVYDPVARETILNDFLTWAKENGWEVINHSTSPIKGGKGKNVEYLINMKSI